MVRKTHKDKEEVPPPAVSEEEHESDAPDEKAENEDDGSADSAEDVKTGKEKSKKKSDKDKGADDDDKKKKKKKRRIPEASHPPTTEMVLDALMALDEKKGTTIKAIKDHIMQEHTVRPEALSHLMRKALKKLVEKEGVIRPKGEETKSLMMGRYKIAPKKEEKNVKPRERPSSLRKLGSKSSPKKKKKKRKQY